MKLALGKLRMVVLSKKKCQNLQSKLYIAGAVPVFSYKGLVSIKRLASA